MNILISKIRIDGGTQNRVQIDPQTVKEYSDAITEGSNFPPITVFFDGASYWLADGFHRYWAHNDIGSLNIDCDVINGSCRDAFIYSLGANHKHGLPRSNDDKKKSVLAALNDTELSKLSQSKIAEICKVSREYVSRISQTISPSCDRSQDNKRKVERNGKTYEQDTSNIGKSQAKKEPDIKPGLKIVHSQDKPQNTLTDKEYEEALGDALGGDTLKELEEAYKEIEQLKAQIAAMSKDDLAAQVQKEVEARQGIEARLSYEMDRVNRMDGELRYFGKMNAELRKLLGVERNNQIVSAVKKIKGVS